MKVQRKIRRRKRKYLEVPSTELLKQELGREKYKRRYRRVLKSTFNTLLVVAAIAALIATLLLPVLEIAGISMEPSLNDGDIVLLVRTDNLETGDLCAFYFSNKILIKRVIGTPGDYVSIDKDGTVYVNNEELQEPYISEKALGECDIEFPYQVTENNYFMMGDHRKTSIDSRSSVIGGIAEDQIIGKIICKIWPLSEIRWMN